MGRYADKITLSYSTDPNRPTVLQTFEQAKRIYLNSIMEKLTPQQQQELICWGKQEKLFYIE